MATNPTAQRLVSGRYALLETIGKGGMGVVWRGRDTLLERDVAIKEIALPAAIPVTERDALRARVNREARAAARLTHPSVVTIFDVVEDEGTSYIVMELIDAPTLADLVKRNGPLPPVQAAVIGLDVLAALEKAHGAGIVHRDVKPGNIMVPPDGRAKLGDFGIASIKGDPKITTTGMIMGSPSFMAPEQATGAPLGPEVDLWSLGASLYYAVEGRPPFDRGQAIPTLTAVVHDEVQPTARAGALGPVLYSVMAKVPADRPSHEAVREMLNGVVSATDGDSPTATAAVGPSAVASAGGATSAVPTTAMEDDWGSGDEWEDEEAHEAGPEDATTGRGPRGWLIGATGVLLLALIGGLAFLLTSEANDPTPPSSDDNVARRRDDGPDRVRGGGGGKPTQQPSATPTQSPSPSPTPTASATPAGDTTAFTIGDTGFVIDRPSDWTEVPESTDDDSVDFRDPTTGTYLRVDWTDTPGDDAAQAWRDLEKSFASRHDNYRRVRIEDVDFQDFEEAALWEFTWTSGGTQLHAYDLGVVANDGSNGFALNFVTREENWEASQQQWRSFLDSFRPTE